MARKKAPRRASQTDEQSGARLRSIRMDKGISQEQLAKVLGVSFQQIQKYEKGMNRMAASRLIQIAETLETTPHELLGWNGQAPVSDTKFDAESYKLAREFRDVPDDVKKIVRALLVTIKK